MDQISILSTLIWLNDMSHMKEKEIMLFSLAQNTHVNKLSAEW